MARANSRSLVRDTSMVNGRKFLPMALVSNMSMGPFNQSDWCQNVLAPVIYTARDGITGSFALVKLRFTLLQKCLHPLFRVGQLGGRSHNLNRVLVGMMLRQINLRVKCLLAQPLAEPAPTRSRLQQVQRLLFQLLWRDNPINESPVRGGLRIDGIAGEEHF